MQDENLFAVLRGKVLAALETLAPGLAPEILARVEVTPTKDAAHGDMATNAAMIAAKPAGKNPRELAVGLVEALSGQHGIEKAEAAGPGFVNLTLSPALLLAQLPVILTAQEAYGQGAARPGKINVEYVSANPTGPLHVGHCRGAVVGDALANLLRKAGHDVVKEYYVNDAGAQVQALARSSYVRYLEALGRSTAAYIESVQGGMQYGGAYLIPIGQALAEKYGDKYAETPEAAWLDLFRDFAIEHMMGMIREDLAALGVHHDVFSSERALVENGGVERGLDALREKGLIYRGILEPPKGKTPEDWEPREQELFRSTEYGDDVDRPVSKSDGSYTYFANDIAYHNDKIIRGPQADLIDVLGADHGGYVKRMQAAVKALSGGRLDVVLCQIVKVMKDGEPVKMSKRAGTFVELRDLIDEVGPNAVRFLMLMRKSDAQMEFDLNAAVAQTRENPVFYVQYAHARARSVLRAAPAPSAEADFSTLTAPEEMALLRRLLTWPRLVEQAAEAREPHRVAFFLYDLASDFHALWNAGRDNAALRFLQEDKPAETAARIGLVAATAIVLRSALAVLGVTPVEEMR
ncbi:arginine--tRNA ligase [Acidocella sp. MX-AZ02]|uniref:arginine--tRNA ligase n=1 Tax=Acidocella sp. MX-AZ02 TaxID=1214225 RepID=UPI00028E33E4|nr:arginine--tRNA ligase [Acidocella sp. MX-AZ02]EKN00750.1 arginyl-tRNA ligase [Acidocella sp. MX-AZ02]